MKESGEPITLAEARSRIVSQVKSRETEIRDLVDAAGFILAEDIRAPFSQPPFRRSAMDGYAVRAEDCQALLQGGKTIQGKADTVSIPADQPGDAARNAAEADPSFVRLKVAGEIDAGDSRKLVCEPGQAWRIMTGARVPDGADMVVQQEFTDYGMDEVTISRMMRRDNIAPVGEDFLQGDVLAHQGERLDAFRIASIAAAGIMKVPVLRRPKIALLSTGSELAAPGACLAEGQIYNSSGKYLETRLRQTGCELTDVRQLRDDSRAIEDAVRQASRISDLVITTGGVSVGERDYLAEVMHHLGAQILFHGIAVKPGMPTMAAVLDGTVILSLSGNPYSATAIFEYLFPYAEHRKTWAVTAEDYTRSRKVFQLVRGRLTEDGVQLDAHSRNGTTKVAFHANCLAELPAGGEPISAGTKIKVLLIQ